MIKAVLFDLDDTLLGNHMDTFIPRYFALLSQYAAAYLPRDQFLKVLLTSSQAMTSNTDLSLTNRDVFWQSFTAQTALDAAEMEAYFETFYREEFPIMADVAQRRETAVSLVQFLQQQGYQVVIATNPMFPRAAVVERLRWAGLPAAEFSFDLITTYENMHTTKPHLAYYQEILREIGAAASEVLMVGDDWENDIQPAAALGCFTYWLPMNGETAPPINDVATGYGSLEDLFQQVTNGWLTALA